MGLFKSKEERRIERDMEVRKGLGAMKRQIKMLEKHQVDYLDKARRAKGLGDDKQLAVIKGALKRAAAQRKTLERQMLSLETMMQIRNQAEINATFAQSMNAVSRSIAEAFGSTDFERTQRDFEKAVSQAETMEQRIDMFLDMGEQVFTTEPVGAADALTDAEIDRLIEGGETRKEGSGFDAEIAERLGKLDKELGDENS